MDLVASGFYIFEYFSALGVNGLMRIMEIENTEEMRPILEQISLSTRTLPSIIIFAATSRLILFLVLNFVIAFVFPSAVWRVCKENEEIVEHRDEPVAASPKRTHDVNLTVTRNEPSKMREGEEEAQGQSAYDSQPPFNPYLTNSSKQETHF